MQGSATDDHPGMVFKDGGGWISGPSVGAPGGEISPEPGDDDGAEVTWPASEQDGS